jgi:hypothetical protein
MRGATAPIPDVFTVCTGATPFVIHLGGIKARKIEQRILYKSIKLNLYGLTLNVR